MGLIKTINHWSDGLMTGEYTLLPTLAEGFMGPQPGPEATREERLMYQYTRNTIRTWEYTAIPLVTSIGLVVKFNNLKNLLTTSAGITVAEILAMVFLNRQIVLASQQAVSLDPANEQDAHMLGIIKETYERTLTNLGRFEKRDPELMARLVEHFGNSRKGRARMHRLLKNLEKVVTLIKLKKLPDGFIARMTKDPNAFAFSPTDPAMAYTQGIVDQRFDPNIPEPATMRDSHLLCVTGHEFMHLLEQDVLMLALVAILGEGVSLLSDGVAKQASIALEPVRALLSKIKWLKPFVDKFWDDLVGQLFYGGVNMLNRMTAAIVGSRREAVADLGAVSIIDRVEEEGAFVQAEEAMAQALERLRNYMIYRQEHKRKGESDLYAEEFTGLKEEYLQKRLAKLGLTGAPTTLRAKVQTFFANCQATAQARHETFMPRRNAMQQLVNPFVDFSDPGNLPPMRKGKQENEPQRTPTGPFAAIVAFFVWLYHATKLDMVVEFVQSLGRLAQSMSISAMRNHDTIDARAYMSREVIGKGAPNKVRFLGAVMLGDLWKLLTGQPTASDSGAAQ